MAGRPNFHINSLTKFKSIRERSAVGRQRSAFSSLAESCVPIADSFPLITFKSTRIERQGDAATIHGNLTMRGVTRPVVLEGRFLGLTKFPNNFDRVGFEATTTINRLDFGVSWNRLVEGAGMTLGDDVKIDITIEASRKRPS